MSVNDEKKSLRNVIKQKRKQITPKTKSENDKKIFNALLSLEEIKNAKVILTYVSMKNEVDTQNFINALLGMNKKVAVAKCEDKEGKMSFYSISSLNELKKSNFGILEPEIRAENKLTDFENSVCIIPALAFDKKRQRIGYGKGYYDRFLENFKGVKIGLCYDEMLLEKLPCDKFDIAADIVVTQSKII